MAAVTVHSDFGAQWKMSLFPLFSPPICNEVMGPDAVILVFCMPSFKPGFSLSFFTLIKRPFSSSSVYCHKGGIIYLSQVIDISPGNLDSSLCFIQPAFHMMYSAYKLNKQGDNLQPWHTLSQSGNSIRLYVFGLQNHCRWWLQPWN